MLKLKLNGTELQILKDDAVIFSIIKGNEILHTGYGENKFKMDRGSFKISEKILKVLFIFISFYPFYPKKLFTISRILLLYA